MKTGRLCRAMTVMLFSTLLLLRASGAQTSPLIDYHQHLFSPAVAKLSPSLQPVNASALITLLDAAGIRRALVLSIAYQFSNPNKPPVENEYAQVRAENDWTSQQVALFPGRLRGFCSVNPLKDFALTEIERCAKDSQLHFGLKLHFGNSDVGLENPGHAAKLRAVFHAANEHGMAIVVHMHPSVTMKRAYGAEKARIFLTELLPAASDVPVQIAHLAGAGGYDEPAVDEALAVFVEAIANHDPRMSHVYFDASSLAGFSMPSEKANLIASRIRQLGINRVLYGSDGAGVGNLAPREAWAAFRELPLSDEEFRTVENNVVPYMK